VNVEVTLGRHDERLCDIEKRQDKMDAVLNRIYFALVGIGGGVIMSLVLLIMQMKAGVQ
jgi:hypothetical protein